MTNGFFIRALQALGERSAPRADERLIAVEVLTDRDRYTAGEVIWATMRARAEGRVEIESATVVLAWRDRHITAAVEMPGVVGFDPANTVRSNEAVVVDWKPVLGRTRLQPGEVVERQCVLTLAADAPPTGAGELSDLSWLVGAQLQLDGHHVIERDVPIIVLSPSSPPRARPTTAEISTDDYHLVMDLGDIAVRPGGTVHGSVVMTTLRDVKVRETKISLERAEHSGKDSGGLFSGSASLSRTVSEVVVGENAGSVPAGTSRHSTFSITIPADACPSRWTPTSRVTWRLVARVDRPRRPDEKCELELRVLSPIRLADGP